MSLFFRSVARWVCLSVGLDVATALVRGADVGFEIDPKLLEHGPHEAAAGQESMLWPKQRYNNFNHQNGTAAQHNHTIPENSSKGVHTIPTNSSRTVHSIPTNSSRAVHTIPTNSSRAVQTIRRNSSKADHTIPTNSSRAVHTIPRNSSRVVLALQSKVEATAKTAWPSIPQGLVHAGRTLRDVLRRGIEPLASRLEGRTRTEGVVHFLFLLKNSLPHYSIWERFFESAAANTWRAWAHCAEGCDEEIVAQFPALRIVETVPSSYCVDLVSPMAQLLRASLKDESIPQGTMQKFVFVSSATLPTKPYRVVHKVLTAKEESDICLLSPQAWAAAKVDGRDFRLAKHSQWTVLNKNHAQIFANGWLPQVPVRGFAQALNTTEDPIFWNVSLPSINGKAPTLVPRRWFSGKVGSSGGICTDEEAMFTTIFGALEVDERHRTTMTVDGLGLVAYDKMMPLQGKCHTLVAWNMPPSSVAAYVHDDPNSTMIPSVDGDSHPFEFRELSNRSLAAVRAHASLFMRKLSEDADLKHWADIVFLDSVHQSRPFREAPLVPVYGQIRAHKFTKDSTAYCLDVDHASGDARRLLWSECSYGSQTSRFIFDEGVAGLLRWGGYPLEDRCLEVEHGYPTAGAAIILGSCGDDQGAYDKIFFVSRSSQETEIRWALYPDMCLEVGGEDGEYPQDSDALKLASCNEEGRRNKRRFLVPDPKRESYDIL
eukprot:TRINITY_DN3300_c0_g1_i1.p1 TRINITY_DN3300_c0_g1~~TRINITY_DN3300_c0_g1_i1.p1  ORF type:complete len:713 (-),score=72.84 TRINITY_DN3300_c0_g1_i1:423-2561(-)